MVSPYWGLRSDYQKASFSKTALGISELLAQSLEKCILLNAPGGFVWEKSVAGERAFPAKPFCSAQFGS